MKQICSSHKKEEGNPLIITYYKLKYGYYLLDFIVINDYYY